MTKRKNTKRFDPRYFMDEKTDIIIESSGERVTIEDLEKQAIDFEKLAQVFRDDFGHMIEKAEVLIMPGHYRIPYAKVSFLNGARKYYYDLFTMQQDIWNIEEDPEIVSEY